MFLFQYSWATAFLILLRVNDSDGFSYVLFTLLCNWSADTGALVVGSLYGKTPVAGSISPAKTVEGVLGGILFSVLGTLLLFVLKLRWLISMFDNIGLQHLVIISVLIAIVGMIGDILESCFKRAAKAKDSSGLFNAHGGMLDKLDSLSLCCPVIFFYIKYVRS